MHKIMDMEEKKDSNYDLDKITASTTTTKLT